ncbi:unnamed protein product [Commensalibacter communis]|uniref:Uncharacterized protein n=1 Tax=Commensalibacter communis TaxID=2972786 RepID=A0A9W4X629_9PROT|nr:hypothetical protein [Commensalibacter communis]CAI3925744.1 unnamed protein product [Commensalibacter communis]CAI3927616.1 unnamed protein product [Commensalibacter communis]CAI3929112.1 unnamed protein product [Commensalibacter communis]CAI3933381.1 unnamed protein product [Commensalibacter communis]CAI3933918.1 unnamed protein product [Commensalibacter communis]
MIEIKGERELIQIDVTQSNTDKKQWQSGDNISCNIYFQKLECKFASKDIVISYDALEMFANELKMLINSHRGGCGCSFTDENQVIFLGYEIDRNPSRPVIVLENNVYKVGFNLLYHKGSDIFLSGYLYSSKEQLQQTIQQIERLL